MRSLALGGSFLLLALAGALAGCSDTGPSGPAKLDKLKWVDVVPGTGPAAQNGDTLLMEYTGKLANGKVFDSTSKRDDAPFAFVLGTGNVIKGWDQGLVGMKEGGQRKLMIPAELGYGANAKGDDIPANSDLYFDVKLDKVVKKEDANDVTFKEITPGTGRVTKTGDTVSVKYTGSFVSGKVFDPGKEPLQVKLGEGKVVPGFEQALTGMKLGEERKVTIPPQWGYGGNPPAGIPEGSWLVFDVKIISIK